VPAYILRRLCQSALTVLGVMAVTFLLFRVFAGDIAAAHLGERASEPLKADWRHKHGYDRPLLLNLHKQLLFLDKTKGEKPFSVKDRGHSNAAEALALFAPEDLKKALAGRYVFGLSRATSIEKLTDGHPLLSESSKEPPVPPATMPATNPTTAPSSGPASRPAPADAMEFSLADGSKLHVRADDVRTCGQLMDRVNNHPDNKGRLEVKIPDMSAGQLLNSQFVDHLRKSVTFQGRSLTTNQTLTEIIAKRAPYSLALTIPAMTLGWISAMIVASLVAYYRGRLADKIGVFLSVLGMCVPFLAFMIYGQWLMFVIAPFRAYGLSYRSNIYVPVIIMVIAGLGASVRFYRTVILDEVNRDYVRTARAKGLPLSAVLFKHVLKNCMLPILTNLILSIPFLIMGSLLAETYFGIPGLGDLMINSINGRDEPILSGLVFLSALIYTIGVLVTDLSYAVFDPRIRLQ